jgi:hypothetical protein
MLVFSKRWLKVWPNINSVANRIDKAMATFSNEPSSANRERIVEAFECTPNEVVKRIGGFGRTSIGRSHS